VFQLQFIGLNSGYTLSNGESLRDIKGDEDGLGYTSLSIYDQTQTVEYFTPMANKCPRGDRHHQLEGMFKKHVLAEAGSLSSKAAAILTRGAYMEYVSTAKR